MAILVVSVVILLWCGSGSKVTGQDVPNLESRLNETMDMVLRQLIPIIVRTGSEAEISTDCAASFLTVIKGLRNLDYWALAMFDATGKLPSGIMEGTGMALGSYDECIRIQGPANSRINFKGQYCSIDVQMRPDSSNWTLETDFHPRFKQLNEVMRNFPLRIGICLPSSCTPLDADKLTQYGAKYYTAKSTLIRCHTQQEIELTGMQIVILGCFGALLGIAVVGTILEVISKKKQHPVFKFKAIRILMAFSVDKNTTRFLAIKSGDNDLGSLHGIRFFTFVWIVLGHAYTWPSVLHFVRHRNVFNYFEFQKDILVEVLFNFTPSVDTFFCISGLLTVYTGYLEYKKLGKFRFVRFYVHRIWRLIPALAVCIGISIILPLFGDGPLWDDYVTGNADNCVKNGWSTLIFIQNFWDLGEQCLYHTWYLATSMQFHLITVLIIWPLFIKPVWGLTINLLFLLVGTLATGILTAVDNHPPAAMLRAVHVGNDLAGVISQIYVTPFCHVGAYCIGIFLGYLLVKYRDIRIPIWTQIALWCCAITTNLAVIYGLHSYRLGAPIDPATSAVYASLHRIAWSLGLSWLIFACVTNRAGVINRILSWKIFIPLGKLTYCAYLLHVIVMLVLIGNTRDVVHFDHMTMVTFVLTTTLLSFGFAYILHVLVEVPFCAFEHILLRPAKNTSTSNRSTEVTPTQHPLYTPTMVMTTMTNGTHDTNGTTNHVQETNGKHL